MAETQESAIMFFGSAQLVCRCPSLGWYIFCAAEEEGATSRTVRSTRAKRRCDVITRNSLAPMSAILMWGVHNLRASTSFVAEVGLERPGRHDAAPVGARHAQVSRRGAPAPACGAGRVPRNHGYDGGRILSGTYAGAYRSAHASGV